LGKWQGQFRSGKPAEQLKTSSSGQIPFDLGESSIVLATAWEDNHMDNALSPQIQEELSPLQDILEFLWKHHKKIDTQIVGHTVEFDVQNKKWKVARAKATCLQINTEKKSTCLFPVCI